MAYTKNFELCMRNYVYSDSPEEYKHIIAYLFIVNIYLSLFEDLGQLGEELVSNEVLLKLGKYSYPRRY